MSSADRMYMPACVHVAQK